MVVQNNYTLNTLRIKVQSTYFIHPHFSCEILIYIRVFEDLNEHLRMLFRLSKVRYFLR